MPRAYERDAARIRPAGANPSAFWPTTAETPMLNSLLL